MPPVGLVSPTENHGSTPNFDYYERITEFSLQMTFLLNLMIHDKIQRSMVTRKTTCLAIDT